MRLILIDILSRVFLILEHPLFSLTCIHSWTSVVHILILNGLNMSLQNSGLTFILFLQLEYMGVTVAQRVA